MFDYMMIFFLIASLVINGFLLYYCINVAKRLVIASANFQTIEDIFSSFEAHLNTVHDSEMFYGDTTIQALIEHSGMVLEEISKFKENDNFVFYEEYEEEDLRVEEKTTTTN